MQVTVSTPTRAPFTKMLGEREGKVARNLLGGHAPSIAKAVMALGEVRESLFSLFLHSINEECNNLCRRSPENTSLFRKMPLSKIVNLNWSALVSWSPERHFYFYLKPSPPLLHIVILATRARLVLHTIQGSVWLLQSFLKSKKGNVWSPISPFTVDVLLSLREKV